MYLSLGKLVPSLPCLFEKALWSPRQVIKTLLGRAYGFRTNGSSESDEADLLTVLIDEYEKKHYPIEAPDPIEAIKIRMEEMQLR